jgi:hypothetical protein
MSKAKEEFIRQLQALGYKVQDHGGDKVSFCYVIPTGKFAETEIRLGFVAPSDFPLTPPSGPHLSPELLPRKSGGTHPDGGVNDSPFGQGWQYWSRPLNHWAQTSRSVKDVLAHIRHLFHTQ